MAQASGKVAITEQEIAQSIRRASRRTVLCALLLSGFVWVLAVSRLMPLLAA